ncbi:hypothetical protein [Pelomonas cellulosilytica]|nr:hypothetical protein [Pelomonas sp. P8]
MSALPSALRPLHVPPQRTARMQEAHLLIGHTWCALVEEALAP